jgi:hypothetical protein
MVGSSRKAQDLAVQLLGFSREDSHGREYLDTAVNDAFDRLRAQLSIRLGSAGYRALLVRAAALARTEHPWLATLQIDGEANLHGFAEAVRSQDMSLAVDAGVLLIACLVGLLQTFIGEELTRSILNDALPKPPHPDSAGSKENNNG